MLASGKPNLRRNDMKYEAPQILQTVDATSHIKGGNKGTNILKDAMHPTEFNATSSAYEADE
jgi:hypothetical protein